MSPLEQLEKVAPEKKERLDVDLLIDKMYRTLTHYMVEDNVPFYPDQKVIEKDALGKMRDALRSDALTVSDETLEALNGLNNEAKQTFNSQVMARATKELWQDPEIKKSFSLDNIVVVLVGLSYAMKLEKQIEDSSGKEKIFGDFRISYESRQFMGSFGGDVAVIHEHQDGLTAIVLDAAGKDINASVNKALLLGFLPYDRQIKFADIVEAEKKLLKTNFYETNKFITMALVNIGNDGYTSVVSCGGTIALQQNGSIYDDFEQSKLVFLGYEGRDVAEKDSSWTGERVNLGSGDKLILYTDGVQDFYTPKLRNRHLSSDELFRGKETKDSRELLVETARIPESLSRRDDYTVMVIEKV